MFQHQVNAFMMIAAALSLDLSRWNGLLPGGTAHLLESLRTCRNYVATIGEEGQSSLAIMDRILGALFKPGECQRYPVCISALTNICHPQPQTRLPRHLHIPAIWKCHKMSRPRLSLKLSQTPTWLSSTTGAPY
jgi:hypothetical protein